MMTLASYLVALALFGVLYLFFSRYVTPYMTPLVEGSSAGALAIVFVGGFLTTFGAIGIHAALATHTALSIGYVMLLVPGVLILANDVRRVARSSEEVAGVKEALEAVSEPERRGVAEEIAPERTELAGHAFGLLVGLGFFV